MVSEPRSSFKAMYDRQAALGRRNKLFHKKGDDLDRQREKNCWFLKTVILFNEYDPPRFPSSSEIGSLTRLGHGEKMLRFSTEMSPTDVIEVITW